MTRKIVSSVLELVGQTPLIRLSKLSPAGGAEICAKLEARNPGGSVKDRPALAMIEAAEQQGLLQAGSTIIEATSGNTGISLAMIAAVRGYRCTLVMPEDMSMARRHILTAYGAKVVLTPAVEGMTGAVEQAQRLLKTTRGAFMPRQFGNPANPEAHFRSTAAEIWDATEGKLDAVVVGVGTGGTITGISRFLKERSAGVKIVAVEPRSSAVLSGGSAGLHGIQGIGAGFVPEVLDVEAIDEVIPVSDLAADRMARRLASDEGLLLGPSSGANVHAALQLAKGLQQGQRVVTILCDTGERYLC